MILDGRYNYWQDLLEENHQYKEKVYALMWEVYIKYEKKLIKRYFLVKLTPTKGENIVWNCVEDNVIKEKEDYKVIGIYGFG